MDLEENQYKIETKRKGEKLVHTCWTGDSKDIKDILRNQMLDERKYQQFKRKAEGMRGLVEKLDLIRDYHKKLMTEDKGIEIFTSTILYSFKGSEEDKK